MANESDLLSLVVNAPPTPVDNLQTSPLGTNSLSSSFGMDSDNSDSSFLDDSVDQLSSIAGPASSILGIVTSLLQGHAIRAKDATSEDAAMNQIMPGVTSTFQQIAANVNSGKYTVSQAKTALGNLLASYNSFVASLQGKPGIADDHNPPGGVCGKQCTIGCCLRGAYVQQTINKFLAAFSSGSGAVGTSGIPASKYGFIGIMPWNIQVTVPKGISGSVSSILGVLPGQSLLSSSKTLVILGLVIIVGAVVILRD